MIFKFRSTVEGIHVAHVWPLASSAPLTLTIIESMDEHIPYIDGERAGRRHHSGKHESPTPCLHHLSLPSLRSTDLYEQRWEYDPRRNPEQVEVNPVCEILRSEVVKSGQQRGIGEPHQRDLGQSEPERKEGRQ